MSSSEGERENDSGGFASCYSDEASSGEEDDDDQHNFEFTIEGEKGARASSVVAENLVGSISVAKHEWHGDIYCKTKDYKN